MTTPDWHSLSVHVFATSKTAVLVISGAATVVLFSATCVPFANFWMEETRNKQEGGREGGSENEKGPLPVAVWVPRARVGPPDWRAAQ